MTTVQSPDRKVVSAPGPGWRPCGEATPCVLVTLDWWEVGEWLRAVYPKVYEGSNTTDPHRGRHRLANDHKVPTCLRDTMQRVGNLFVKVSSSSIARHIVSFVMPMIEATNLPLVHEVGAIAMRNRAATLPLRFLTREEANYFRVMETHYREWTGDEGDNDANDILNTPPGLVPWNALAIYCTETWGGRKWWDYSTEFSYARRNGVSGHLAPWWVINTLRLDVLMGRQDLYHTHRCFNSPGYIPEALQLAELALEF